MNILLPSMVADFLKGVGQHSLVAMPQNTPANRPAPRANLSTAATPSHLVAQQQPAPFSGSYQATQVQISRNPARQTTMQQPSNSHLQGEPRENHRNHSGSTIVSRVTGVVSREGPGLDLGLATVNCGLDLKAAPPNQSQRFCPGINAPSIDAQEPLAGCNRQSQRGATARYSKQSSEPSHHTSVSPISCLATTQCLPCFL